MKSASHSSYPVADAAVAAVAAVPWPASNAASVNGRRRDERSPLGHRLSSMALRSPQSEGAQAGAERASLFLYQFLHRSVLHDLPRISALPQNQEGEALGGLLVGLI